MPTEHDRTRYSRVKALFLEAADLPGSAQVALVQRARAEDARLGDELASMLAIAAEDQARGAIDATPRPLPTPTGAAGEGTRGAASASVDGLRPGIMVGPYVLREPLGEGGFGSVWIAEQASPVRRDVALKVLRTGLDSRAVMARFAGEARALAMMEHPGIARVFDAGVATLDADRGVSLPYFAMELVRGGGSAGVAGEGVGQAITTYARTRGLSIEARLGLVLQACRAVQHAHTKGIIHRDIKPSNLLVSEQDGTPTVKVIDFGIAKALHAEAAGASVVERTLSIERGVLLGTPAYMSPEQAGGGGGGGGSVGGSSGSSDTDVDTRSDVYALGIVLYELLTGRTPLDRQTLAKSSLIEVMRLVRESEAPAPSAVRTAGAEPGGQAVPRELDWIVLRAIEKDRSRRYQSAADMAADIERFLRHEPVLARPPSLAYRAAKFVRRRRGLVALAAGASVIAGSALVWAGVNFFEAQRQRDAATALAAAERLARDQADLATRRSERTQEFLLNILRAANINTPGKRKDATIAEALEAATAQLDDPKRQVDPPVDAKIRQVIAVAYIGLGVYDRAEAQSAKAMTLARTLPAAEATVLSDVLTTRVTALRNVRRDEEAVPLAQEAVRLAEAGLASVPGDAPAMVIRNAQIRLADALGTAVSLVSGTPSEAELVLAARSVALHEEVYGVASHRALGAAMRQAVLLGYAERYPEALVVARRVVEQTRASETPRSYAMSVRLDTLAVLTRLSGDAATSATLHDEAIAMAIEFVGPEDVRLATLYGNAAEAQIAVGNQARAAEMLVRSYTIYTTGNPTALAGHARGAERIGESLLKINHPADAAMVYERGLAALTTLIEQAGTDEAKAELLARRTAMEAKLAEARRAIK